MKLRSLSVQAVPNWGNKDLASYNGILEVEDSKGQVVTIILNHENARKIADVIANYAPGFTTSDWRCELYPEVKEKEDGEATQEG